MIYIVITGAEDRCECCERLLQQQRQETQSLALYERATIVANLKQPI